MSDMRLKVESLYQGHVQGHYLYNTIQSFEHSRGRNEISTEVFYAAVDRKYELHITLDIDRWGGRRFFSGALQT